MTHNPWSHWQPRIETPEETAARADNMERLLVALAVHGTLIVDLAGHSPQAVRQRGALVAFQRKITEARQYLREEGSSQRRKYQAARLVRTLSRRLPK